VLDALDAAAVRRWYRWGLAALDASRAEIDSLNVFPVADSDTGTNLHQTLLSAVEAADDERADSTDLAATATAMARLCLLGARGSSGVILSQLLRGVGEVLAAQRRPARGVALTEALERGVELAYASVAQPVEGTMLTVVRAAAAAARATGSDDLAVVTAAAVGAAHESLARTPEQLKVLEQAGVVDAGGRGIVVLLDVLDQIVAERAFVAPQSRLAAPLLDREAPRDVSPAYEVMYLIDAADDRIPGLRAALDEIGDAVVISGGDGLWNVHVHTDDAAAAVDLGAVTGRPHNVRVTEIGVHEARHDGAGRMVVVVVAAGSEALAIRDLLLRAGSEVVEVADLPTQLAVLPAAELVVLVETGELADQVRLAVAANAGCDAVVVPVAMPVQLLSAVAVHDPHRPLADDAAAMAAAASATRCATVGPAPIDRLCSEALAEVTRLLVDGGELLTVVAAADVGARIADELAGTRPDIDVNHIDTGLLGSVVWLGVE
jgi:DAK2 domain fusion protein YloV